MRASSPAGSFCFTSRLGRLLSGRPLVAPALFDGTLFDGTLFGGSLFGPFARPSLALPDPDPDPDPDRDPDPDNDSVLRFSSMRANRPVLWRLVYL